MKSNKDLKKPLMDEEKNQDILYTGGDEEGETCGDKVSKNKMTIGIIGVVIVILVVVLCMTMGKGAATTVEEAGSSEVTEEAADEEATGEEATEEPAAEEATEEPAAEEATEEESPEEEAPETEWGFSVQININQNLA